MMLIFAIYHDDIGFIGLYASPNSSKSFTRDFVDYVICEGKEGSCDLLAQKAGLNYNWNFKSIMNWFGWERESNLDCYDQTFSCYAFKAVCIEEK